MSPLTLPAPPPPDSWPERAAGAFVGLIGDFIRLVGPHSEADEHALALQLLVAVGNLVGRGPRYEVEADQHFGNLFAVVVGESSKARKGTSWGYVEKLLTAVDPTFPERVTAGLSSGEGLVYSVRDGSGDDEGAPDKRLLVVEGEFASPLRIMERDGNTLSATLRQLWDRGRHRSLVKNSPVRTTGAHVSVVGHITQDELRRYLSRTESANGFGNRILWIVARRSKMLPHGGQVPQDEFDSLARRLRSLLAAAANTGRLRMDDRAAGLWEQEYADLSRDRYGLVGAVTSRSEAQTLRLACLYSLLDGSEKITEAHLAAALALWAYCLDSATFIFGDSLGDPLADRILEMLGAAPDGLTRTEIRDGLKRHKRSHEISRALEVLVDAGKVRFTNEDTGGRPAQRFHRL